MNDAVEQNTRRDADADIGSRKSVLVIEDDMDISVLVKAIINMSFPSIHVIGVTTGMDALKILDRISPSCPIAAIIDYMLPGMFGDAVLIEIRKKCNGIPAAIMSAGTIRPDVASKFDTVMSKPISFDELISFIKKAEKK